MARAAKSSAAAEPNPESDERKRLKHLAITKGIISKSQSKPSTALNPSKIVAKHHGADIIRKSQRKNRYLFSFPGLVAPVSGGKIGELKDLASKNPILYVDFPQGQMKLFGTIVFPENRYLTLQFSRGGKNVMCEDFFDTMIVFSDAWWIGRKEENPEEARLDFPKELLEGQKVEFEFKGGAGGASEVKLSAKKSEPKVVQQESPLTELDEDSFDGQSNLNNLQTVTPSRHSERTAGKRINFAEASSGDDIVDVDTSEDEDQKEGVESPTIAYALKKAKAKISLPSFDIENEDPAACSGYPEQVQQSAKSITKSKEISHSNRGSLVQTTISSLFKKVEDEKLPNALRKSPRSKVASQNLEHVDSGKRSHKIEDARPRKKRKLMDDSEAQAGSEDVADEQPEGSNLVKTDKIYKRKTKTTTASSASGTGKASRVTVSKVVAASSIQVDEDEDEDEIEEFSSTSKDSEDGDESDEDWAG